MKAVGLDVSEAQGEIDWDALEVDFVYRRVSNGSLPDKEWALQAHPEPGYRHCLIGGYHAFYPWLPVASQVEAFAGHYDDHGDMELPPSLDCEVALKVDPVGYRATLAELIARIEDRLLRRVILYTRKDWWEKYATPRPKHWPGPLVGRDLWLARATAYLPRDACPSGWLTYAIWQKMFTAIVPGVRRYTDLDEFDGSVEDLRSWAARLRHG